MKANELRIGNYHYYHIVDKCDNPQEWDEVCQIDADDLRILSIKDNAGYKPIPITKEWLLNFGFIENSSRILYTGINEDFKIGYDFGIVKKLLLVFKDGDLMVIHKMDIKYIHELQNIYFDFTRKELLINNQ